MIGYGTVVDVAKRTDEPSLWQELRTAAARLALPFAAVFVVVFLLGLLITRVLDRSDDLIETDQWLARWLEQRRTPTGEDLTHYGTLLGETPVIVGLTALTAAAFRLAYRRWRESVLLVTCVTAQAMIFFFTTVLIDRSRPAVQQLDDSPPTSSFPSGHTAATTAFYAGAAFILAWHTREVWLSRLLVALGILIPLTMATCRMYRGMHYLTDTTTSVVFAFTLLAIAFRLLPLRARARDRVPA
jgi:membrane-associated phospholipid phosphatase